MSAMKINLVLLKCEVSHFAFGVSFMIWCTNQVVFFDNSAPIWAGLELTISCLVCHSPDPPLVSRWDREPSTGAINNMGWALMAPSHGVERWDRVLSLAGPWDYG